jgi:hypothetical protein
MEAHAIHLHKDVVDLTAYFCSHVPASLKCAFI